MTFWETIERGEYVMFALAVIVIAGIVILWVRAGQLKRGGKRSSMMMQRVRDHVVEGDIDNARQICSATTIPEGKVVESGLNHIGSPLPVVKAAMAETASIEKSKMSAGARWLYTFAVVSPLLGLGGTLVGIIDRLRDLGEAGETVDTSMVCGAIAPTIVTTVAGLGVGILAIIFLTILEGTIASAGIKLDTTAKELEDLLNQPA